MVWHKAVMSFLSILFLLHLNEDRVQGLAKFPFLGLVNCVPAVAYHFCLNLPENSLKLGMVF